MPAPMWKPPQNLGSHNFVAPLHVLYNFGLDFPDLIRNFFNLYESQRHRNCSNSLQQVTIADHRPKPMTRNYSTLFEQSSNTTPK